MFLKTKNTKARKLAFIYLESLKLGSRKGGYEGTFEMFEHGTFWNVPTYIFYYCENKKLPGNVENYEIFRLIISRKVYNLGNWKLHKLWEQKLYGHCVPVYFLLFENIPRDKMETF